MAFDPDAYLAKKQPREEAGQPQVTGFDPDAYLKKYGITPAAPEPGFFERLFGGKPSAPAAPSEGGEVVSPEEALTPLPEEPSVMPAQGASIGERLIGGAKYIAGTEPEKRGSLVGDVVAGVERANVGAAGVFRALAESAAPVLDPITGTILPENPLRRIASEFERLGVESEARAKAKVPTEPQDTLSAGVSSGVQSLAQNILAIPMAILPGGQPAAMVMLSSNTGGQAYQDARKKGLSPEQAIPYAVSQASIEYATEVMPLTKLISDINQKTGFGRLLLNQIVREVPGEQIATVLQDMNDWAVLNPEKTAKEYLQERPEAAAQTLIATIVGVGGNVLAGKGLQTALAPPKEKGSPEAPTAPPTARIEPTLGLPPEAAVAPPVEPIEAPAEAVPAVPPTVPLIVPETVPEAQPEELVSGKTLGAEEPVSRKIRGEEPVPEIKPNFINQETNMGSQITQLSSGRNAGQFAVTVYDLDSGMPLNEVRIFKEPERADAYAQDVIGVTPVTPVTEVAPVTTELPYRNKSQRQVIDAVMKNFNLAPEDVAGWIKEGRIKLGKDGKFTAQSVETLRAIGDIEPGSQALKKSLATKVPEVTEAGLPQTPERLAIEQQIAELEQAQKKLAKPAKGESLISVLRGRLNAKEVKDIGDEPHLKTLGKKGGTGEEIADMVANGELDDYLPYELRGNFDQEKEATDYIKDLVRGQNYLTYDTNLEIAKTNETLRSLIEDIEQENTLEDINEQLRIIAEEEERFREAPEPLVTSEERGVTPAEGAPILTQYTAAEEEARLARAEEDRAAAEAKAIADREREVFALTPQVAEQPAAPTGDLFGVRGLAEQPTRATPEAPPTETGLFAPKKDQDFFNDITSASYDSQYTLDRSPSFKREFERLNKLYTTGKISADVVVDELDQLRSQLSQERRNRLMADRKRGAQIVKEKLLAAKRRGDLPAEAVDMAEWFINQNSDLLTDLAISLRQPDERGGLAGQYIPLSRIARIIKGTTSVTAPTHEILHHLERMMPENIRRPIQQSWMRSFLRSQDEANKSGDYALKKYYQLLSDYHFGNGTEESLRRASELIERGAVPYEHYQNFNSSEFWAVNASRIVKGRFDSRNASLAKLRQWLSDLVQKIKVVFGAKSDASIIRALSSLAKADGQFVTGAMLGEAGSYNSVVRKNIFGGPAPNPMWGRPDDSKADNAIAIWQDKMIDTKRVIQEIEQTIGSIQERWDAYLQEELYHGRTAKETNDFLKDELTPLLKDMQQRGVTLVELEEFLHNNTAEERNVQIAKVNPNMPDGGSGIMTADAQKYLASLSPDQRQNLQALANRVYQIIDNTQQLLVNSGLETQQTIDAWKNAYKNYVPLMREEADYEASNIGRGIGQGFSVKGAASKRAVGSSRNVIDILANIAIQREKAIVRSEKLRVAQAIYGLAVQYPNTDFWLAIDPQAIKNTQQTVADLMAIGINPADAANIVAESVTKYIDPVTNKVATRINPLLRQGENVLAVRINGSDKFVFFNTRDPRAVRMVQALKNLDADQLSRAMSFAGRITRYFAAVNTQYNPIFGVINFTRDISGGMLNLSTTPIADKKAQVLANTMPAMRGIYDDIRSRRRGSGPATGQWAQLWEEFQKEGGQTGFRDQFSRSEERAEALAKTLAQLSQGKAKQFARSIFDWLSDYNETLENSVRLAAYKAAKDKGLSNAKAASIAKNLTVNFNRKGQVGKQMGALYAFFNASVQGTARMYQTIKGPAGKKIMYGGLLLGSAQAMLLAAAGFDEDQPPDFVKEKNLVIPLFDGGKYVSIPMPLGFNVIPNTSRVLTEWSMSGFKNTSKRVGQITGAVLDSFNPVGNAGWSFQTFAPTIADPIVALLENKDWTGKPIAKKDISSLDPTPGYTRAKDTASWVSKQLSYYLNLATGGTKYQPGGFSPTPDQIDYLIGQATGGVGREAMKVEQTIRSAITGEELPSYKIPLAGRFYGNAQEASGIRDKFYKNIEMLNGHENEIKGRQKHREDVQGYIAEHPEARLFQQANVIERDIQKMRRHRSELIERGAPKEEVKRIEDMMTGRMKMLNDRVSSVRP